MFHASRGNACRHALRVAKQSGKRLMLDSCSPVCARRRWSMAASDV